MKNTTNRRGRKRQNDEHFFTQAEKRNNQLRLQLMDKTLDVKGRKRLRNQISATNSRVKKKREQLFLNRIVREKDMKFRFLLEAVMETVGTQKLEQILYETAQDWRIQPQEIETTR